MSVCSSSARGINKAVHRTHVFTAFRPPPTMRPTVVLALSLVCAADLLAQGPQREDVYVRSTNALAEVLRPYNTRTRTCTADKESVGGNARIVIQTSLKDAAGLDTAWIVSLTDNIDDEGMAKIGNYYCISPGDLAFVFKKARGPDVGLVAVPFKLRFAPVKVMAGSAVGPFVGKSFGRRDSYTTLLAFAALTNVPLNDLNSDVPQTRWGVGSGLGMVWTIRQNFQVGVISGVDIFDGVEDWAYGYKPWVALSIGFSFLSPTKDQTVPLLPQ